MMSLQTLCIGLILQQFFWISQAELHHAVIFPSELRSQHMENFCIHLVGAQEESNVRVSLKQQATDTILIDRNFPQESKFTCIPTLIPNPSKGNDEVARIEVSIKSGEESVTGSNKVIVKKETPKLLIQTDKPVYNPGQTVLFRILSLNRDLQPGQDSIDVVHLQDPGNNRIAQWLNVKLNQALAELSFPLSSEPPLGVYSIRAQNTVHYFTVEKQLLPPKYEVTLKLPKVVFINTENFPVTLCGRYTIGKPIHGDYNIKICRKKVNIPQVNESSALCAEYNGQMDRSGCSTVQANSETFKLKMSGMQMNLEGSATITEQGTGKEFQTRSWADISNVIAKIGFDRYITTYKPGMPCTVMIRVKNGIGQPAVGERIRLSAYNKDFSTEHTGVSNENGQVYFTFQNTATWEGVVRLEATTAELFDSNFLSGFVRAAYTLDALELKYYYSPSKSFLKIHSLYSVLPCEGQHEAKVEYIIKRAQLENIQQVDLQFLVTSKGSIEQSGVLPIPVSPGDGDLSGETAIKLSLTRGISPLLRVFAYILLPNGQFFGDVGIFFVQRCFNNKVSVRFAPDEVLPGSDVSLQVQADPGSLCGLRAVDSNVVLRKPDKELTESKIHSMFNFWGVQSYDHRIQEPDICNFKKHATMSDAFSLLQEMKLKIITGHMDCPQTIFHYIMALPAGGGSPMERLEGDSKLYRKIEKPRSDFPDTWIFQLSPVGDSGTAEFHHKVPDTITDWNAGALCMGPSGVGLSPPTSLRTVQPFFISPTLPYSVMRGETFPVQATVFNFLNQSIKVQTTLMPSPELEQLPCEDCQYSSCLGADEGKVFSWNVRASKLGEVNVMVRAEAISSLDMCENEIPVVPSQGASDTVIKKLLVQPEGVLQEKSYSSIICNEDAGDSKTEDITLTIPDNTVKGSERAYITVLGDLMGIALQNLEHLMTLPDGYGEENMVHIASNMFILQYLEKTHQLTSEIKNKIIKLLESGYQRQMPYKLYDGSYSGLGSFDQVGNTWLTAFVVKTFSNARSYIFIEEDHLNASVNWLRNHRRDNGCFWRLGRHFNNAMKGGVDDDTSLCAYVTIALLESGMPVTDPLVRDAVTCLKQDAENVTDVYTQALLAYTFTLSQDMELRKTLLDKLEKKAVRREGQLYWIRASMLSHYVPPWFRVPPAEVEIASYVLLAMLSGPEPDMDKSKEIVNWLSKRQNPNGGFSSPQDTVVALQALTKYAKALYRNTGDKTDITVTVTSKTGFLQEFHVDVKNQFLLQRATLPAIPGDYTVTTTGIGCAIVQAVLRYNIPPPRNDNSFAVTARSEKHEEKKLLLNISAEYTGAREKTNMVIMEVKMLSGYTPVENSVTELEKNPVIQKCQISNDWVILHMNELSHKPEFIPIQMQQDIEVTNLQPAIVKVYDYSEAGELGFAEYNSP